MNRKSFFKKRNKGFTLVELIIVIAIIAVLAAVSAPQYVKYVEKGRISVDESYIGVVARSLANAGASEVPPEAAPVTLTINSNGKIQGCTASGPNAASVAAAVDAKMVEIHPDSAQFFGSKYYTGVGSDVSSGVTLVLDSYGGVTISGTKNINTN